MSTEDKISRQLAPSTVESTEAQCTKRVDKPARLQSGAFWLLLLACITSGLLETHFLLGLWVTTGLIGAAGVMVYASEHEGGGDDGRG